MTNVSSYHSKKSLICIYRGVMLPAAWWGTWNHLAMTWALLCTLWMALERHLWPWPSLRGVAKNRRSGFSESHCHAAMPSGAPLAHQMALCAWRISNQVGMQCCWWASWEVVRDGMWVVGKYLWKIFKWGYILPRAKSTSPPAIVKNVIFAYIGGDEVLSLGTSKVGTDVGKTDVG